MEVPENILEKTQQIATAKGISPQAHVDIIAAVISASGGNIDDFRLSRTTGYRSREKVEKVVAANANKSEFQNLPGQVQEIGSDKVTIGEKRAIAKALLP